MKIKLTKFGSIVYDCIKDIQLPVVVEGHIRIEDLGTLPMVYVKLSEFGVSPQTAYKLNDTSSPDDEYLVFLSNEFEVLE